MTVSVPPTYDKPASAALKIGKPTSALRIAEPAGLGINHLIGHTVGGQRHCQTCMGTPTATTGVARVYTYRHPECDYIDVFIRVSAAAQTTWSIVVQAGTGTSKTLAPAWDSLDGTIYRVRVPWNSSDTGDQEVTATFTDIGIRSIAMRDVPRETLVSGDSRVELYDATYLRIGLAAELYVGESATAGPKALVQGVRDAWTHYQPQVFSWWTPASAPLSVSATSYGGKGGSSDFFGGVTFKHRCRQKRSTDTVRDTRWWVRSYGGPSVTGYTIRISSSVGADTASANRTNTSASWGSVISGLSVAADQDDTFFIEGIRTGGTGNVYIEAVSGIEESS